MKFFVVAFLLIGTLLHHCQAAVYTEENERDFHRKCSKILKTSTGILQQIEDTKSYISDDREVHCLVRCIGILSEFYDDTTGIDWDVVAQQLEGKEGFEEHRKATTKCIQALPEEEVQSDVCRKSYLSLSCLMRSHLKHIWKKN